MIHALTLLMLLAPGQQAGVPADAPGNISWAGYDGVCVAAEQGAHKYTVHKFPGQTIYNAQYALQGNTLLVWDPGENRFKEFGAHNFNLSRLSSLVPPGAVVWKLKVTPRCVILHLTYPDKHRYETRVARKDGTKPRKYDGDVVVDLNGDKAYEEDRGLSSQGFDYVPGLHAFAAAGDFSASVTVDGKKRTWQGSLTEEVSSVNFSVDGKRLYVSTDLPFSEGSRLYSVRLSDLATTRVATYPYPIRAPVYDGETTQRLLAVLFGDRRANRASSRVSFRSGCGPRPVRQRTNERRPTTNGAASATTQFRFGRALEAERMGSIKHVYWAAMIALYNIQIVYWYGSLPGVQ